MNRREVLGGLAMAGVVSATGNGNVQAMGENSPGYDLGNPRELLGAIVKMRGSLDGSMSIWWIHATQYAVVDTVLTPLFHIENASFQKFQKISDEKYGITMLELAYFTDLETGEPLDEFTNPFSGLTGKTPPEIFGPNSVSMTLEGLQPPEFFPFGKLTFEGDLGPGYDDGESAWIREDTIVRMTSDNPAFGNYIYNELVSYHGRSEDLRNADLSSVPATLNYNTTSNWRPWMMAGDTSGHIMSEGFGKKVERIEDLPKNYLEIAKVRHPEVLANPEKILDTPPSFPAGEAESPE